MPYIITTARAAVVPEPAKRLGRFPFALERGEWPLLVVVFVITRLTWVLQVPTVPMGDFLLYHRTAIALATGAYRAPDWPNCSLLSPWGYPLFLSVVYRIFGPSLMVGKLLNVALGLAALVILASLAARVGGRSLARFVTYAFVFWPGQLMFSSVMASEHLALPLECLALTFVSPFSQKASRISRDVMLAVCCAGLALFVRPALVSVAGTLLLTVFLAAPVVDGTRLRLLVASIGLMLVLHAGNDRLVVWVTGRSPVSGLSWSVLTGSNHESVGGWSSADAAVYCSSPTLESANSYAWSQAAHRWFSHPLRGAGLFVRKVAHLWRDEDYTVYWSTNSVGIARTSVIGSLLRMIVQSYHSVVEVLAILVIPGLIRFRSRDGFLGVASTVAGATLLHGILESQARYNYVLEPLLVLLVGLGLLHAKEGYQRRRPRMPAEG